MQVTANLKTLFLILFLSLIYLILAVIFTNPLYLNLNSQIPTNLYQTTAGPMEWGDHIQVLAGVREHRNNIEHLISNEITYTKEACYNEVQFCEQSTLKTVFLTIFSPYWVHTLFNFVFGDIVGYNLTIFAYVVLIGFVGFLITKEFLNNFKSPLLANVAAFCGSLLVVLQPKVMHHFLFGQRTSWMMLYFMIVILLVERGFKNGFKFKDSLLIIILNAYIAATEPFLSYFGIIYLFLRVMYFVIDKSSVVNKFRFTIYSLKNYLWFFGSIIISFLINYFNKLDPITTSGMRSGRSLEIIYYNSPFLIDFFRTQAIYPETTVYLGIAGIFILGLIFIILAISTISKPIKSNTFGFKRQDLFFLLFVTVLFIALSMGAKTIFYQPLYDHLPYLNYNRAPARALFILFALLPIIAGVVFSYINKFINNQRILMILTVLATFLTILSLHTSPKIETISLPYTTAIEDNSHILYLPFLGTEDFFNSIYEYDLSFTNSAAINSYNPVITKEAAEAEANFIYKFNDGNLTEDEFKVIARKYKFDTIIIFKKYYGHKRLLIPGSSKTKWANIEMIIEKSQIFQKVDENEHILVYKIAPS